MAAFRVMKYAVLFLIIAFSPTILAQAPKGKPATVKRAGTAKARPNPTPTPIPLTEKEQFDKASAHELAADRVAALDKFLIAFPQSESRTAAAELLATSRILVAEEKLLSGDSAEAVAIYKKVVNDHPLPFPAELFTESISKIPQSLYFRGQRAAAVEIANLIEAKVESDAGQLLEIANFYLRIENGAEAMRVAAKAAAKDPSSGAVYRTIALAHRINFDLELSADSYAKSLELDPESVAAKRGLAEMKRALGKSDEALTLYRDVLSKNEGDTQARNGLILALFESNKRAEAEAELAKSLEKTPNNFALLAGAAYWYASRGVGDKAVDLAQKALAIEPRYIWSHIALARGLVKQGKPAAAEQVLVRARAHASFPTLEYELASVRMAAGFFREAVDDLAKHFTVTDAGVKTRLGGRITRTEKSFADLAAAERRASIFAHEGGDTADDAERLRGLLLLDEELQENEPNEERLVAATDIFTGGTDKMRFHRQVFAASEMLKKRVAPAKVLELAKAVTGNSDAALEVADPAAAVMASELYEPRQAAFRKNDFLLVPDVPRATLSAILRERIEEIAGWALYQQGNFAEATIRLRRAVNVAPPKSAWWRSSMWRLGAALAADGKDSEALNAYIESYKDDKPDYAKFVIVETLYKKVNGSLDGLEAKIGRDRVVASSGLTPAQPASDAMPIVETPAATSTTENSQSNASPPVSVPPISIDRNRDLLRPMPAGVPVATDSGIPKSLDPVPATTPSVEVKKEEPPAVEVKKEDPPTVEVKKEDPPPVEVKKEDLPPVEVKKEDPPPVDVKKEDLSPVEEKKIELPTADVKKNESPPVEIKKEEPTVDPKKDEPPAVEVKKDEPPPIEVKKDVPPPVEVKTDERPPVDVKKDGPPVVEVKDVKKDDPPGIEVKKEEPPADEARKEEPPAVEVKKDEPPAVEVKKEEPPVAQPTTVTKDEPGATEQRKTDPPPVTPQKPDEPTASMPETRKEQKLDAVKTDSAALKVDDAKAAARKPLFEPIIITIPDSRPAKTVSAETKVKADEKSADKKTESAVAGNARPRLIDGQEVKVDKIVPCTVSVSQERISIINNGGNVGLLVGFDGPGDIKTLEAASSNPKDVEVSAEPEISGITDRRFFVIRSVSTATGAYQITFTMPCGSKEVLVTVR